MQYKNSCAQVTGNSRSSEGGHAHSAPGTSNAESGLEGSSAVWGGGAVLLTHLGGPGEHRVSTDPCGAEEGRATHLLTWQGQHQELKDEWTAPSEPHQTGADRGNAHLWGCWRASPSLHLSRDSRSEGGGPAAAADTSRRNPPSSASRRPARARAPPPPGSGELLARARRVQVLPGRQPRRLRLERASQVRAAGGKPGSEAPRARRGIYRLPQGEAMGRAAPWLLAAAEPPRRCLRPVRSVSGPTSGDC